MATPQKIDRRIFLRGGAGLAALGGLGALTGCGLVGGNQAAAAGGTEDKTIKLIVTETAVFQEPTKLALKNLEASGWQVEVKYVQDIIQPNQVVAKGEFDANFFQHLAYLTQFNEDNGLDNEMAFYQFSSPSGIYSKRYTSLKDLPDGARIALPVDPANNGRALVLLAKAGLLEVDLSKSVVHTSQKDITANPHKFTFVEVDQQSLGKLIQDVDAGFLFGVYAAESGLTPDKALAFETVEEAAPYTCGLAGKPGFKDTEKGKALREAFCTDEIKAWYDSYAKGAVSAAWDRDPVEDLKKLQES
ncbi:MetQ/NlpA family ABC transporter substrate-binding protein [Neomicrococcus aestuarii]|uniref:Metal ABC transporter substrate-binding protein n=1 Tax=Neomicrococcus aestuarii TaxID=556325 RepID=A0A1L2ZMZ3_9MICC|nr:MetQ/NlpA family ABC transporter substrate-binding protein [Neomicrococcus aestuarii]APF40773.1 hypothetical protein BHE16_06845 [Neomicrococcus aestuarii]